MDIFKNVGRLWFVLFFTNYLKYFTEYIQNLSKLAEQFINSLRKESIALVNISSGSGNILINKKDYLTYFQNNPKTLSSVRAPLLLLGLEKNYDIYIDVTGGGLTGQSDAIKLALSRSLYNLVKIEDKKKLKESGFLTQNSLIKERKKYGLKKARKAPQFSKR